MQAIKNKIRSRRGASLTFALLLFLVCAVVGSVVLVAGTAASGRMSQIAEMDQRYYSVNSAARLLIELMEKYEIRSEMKADGSGSIYYIDGKKEEEIEETNHKLPLEIIKKIEEGKNTIELNLSPDSNPTGAQLAVTIQATVSKNTLDFTVKNTQETGQYQIILRFMNNVSSPIYKWKLYEVENIVPQGNTGGSTP